MDKRHHYRPQRSYGQGNIFTPVCHSVHRGGLCSRGGVSAPGGSAPGDGGSGPGGWMLRGVWSRGGLVPGGSGPGGVWSQGGLVPGGCHGPPEQTRPQFFFLIFNFFFFNFFKNFFFFKFFKFYFYFLFLLGIPPPRSWLGHMVNERPVRILLECILVTWML